MLTIARDVAQDLKRIKKQKMKDIIKAMEAFNENLVGGKRLVKVDSQNYVAAAFAAFLVWHLHFHCAMLLCTSKSDVNFDVFPITVDVTPGTGAGYTDRDNGHLNKRGWHGHAYTNRPALAQPAVGAAGAKT